MTNSDDFRVWGKEMVDYISRYQDGIEDRPALAQVAPGYLLDQMPADAPQKPDEWNDVLADVERLIMPGVTHWNHPDFHAYYPLANSFASLLGDMLSGGISCVGFSWIASPACTELEMTMMNWLGRMLNLPESFLFNETRQGGGVIQGTASESTLVALLAAKMKAIRQEIEKDPSLDQYDVMSKLVVYTSDQLCATLGTTTSCAFDNLKELGPICRDEGLWFHIDAAYAGNAFICPEYRQFLEGVELADSFNLNPHKVLRVTFDCSALWVKDRSALEGAFHVDPAYLQHQHQDTVIDYRHWQIPLSRRFRSLKLWFVFRLFGVEKLQEYIRKSVSLAKEFEALVVDDNRFEIVAEVVLALVCFRLKGSDVLNRTLLDRINANGKIHMIGSVLKGRYILRMVVCNPKTESRHMTHAWEVISELTTKLLADETN
eukprot:XP_011674080.1 PREDICTED: aromatic-L-amino-acid decarboxylase isoform X2 [Strongylocentrotus purpuratus]